MCNNICACVKVVNHTMTSRPSAFTGENLCMLFLRVGTHQS